MGSHAEGLVHPLAGSLRLLVGAGVRAQASRGGSCHDVDDDARAVRRDASEGLTVKVDPFVGRFVDRLVDAGAEVHHPPGGAYVALRRDGAPIAVYVRAHWVTIRLPVTDAESAVAGGYASLEKQAGSVWYVRYPEKAIADPIVFDEAFGYAVGALGVQPAAEPDPETPGEPALSDGTSATGRAEGPLAGLVLSIARCPEVEVARAKPGHPCSRIVGLQSAEPGVWQVPEPWAGNLGGGRIVFLSSNPSINAAEDYPRGDWTDAKVVDFVTERFTHGWVKNDRVLLLDGMYHPTRVQFWVRVRKRAAELLGREADPGVDYAMTEVVHCKSTKEIGVAKAAPLCVDRHLDRVMAASAAPLVVVLGAKARDELTPLWGLPPGFGKKGIAGIDEEANLFVRTLGGRPRLVAYLWHPTGSTLPQTFAASYPTYLDKLRQVVAGDLAPEHVLPADR